jgi:hypothetical protein
MRTYRFNTQKVFSIEDKREIMSLIRAVSDKAKGIYSEDIYEVENMLFGLFDGILYDNLVTKAVSIPTLPVELVNNIQKITNKVVEHLKNQSNL